MKLTNEQAQNWRMVLAGQIGFMAFILSKPDIEELAERIQSKFSEVDISFCMCDESLNGETIHLDGKVTCNKCHKERVQEA